MPRAVSSRTDSGVRPTRYSWDLTSFGTPTRITRLLQVKSARETGQAFGCRCRYQYRFGHFQSEIVRPHAEHDVQYVTSLEYRRFIGAQADGVLAPVGRIADAD